jgi:peptidoglycan/xylan/chitin deacetylase (PgdA/CDA1 family)
VSLRGAADRIRKQFANGGAILLYHRVTCLDRDPQLLAVTPEHFAQHVEILRRKVRVVTLQKLAQEARSGLRKPAVAITFDDGYADNVLEAKPILERAEMPATVFVVSGSVGSELEFWWDELDRLLLLPEDGGWHVEAATSGPERRSRYVGLCNDLKHAPASTRAAVLQELLLKTQHSKTGRQSHRVMTEVQLRCLIDGLMEVGAHTVSHPMLSSMDPNEQESEIKLSKHRLEELTEKPVTTFAYPYGGRHDYNRQSVECVRRAGFSLACSNFSGMVWPTTNSLELPRFLIRNWDGNEFERKLQEIFQ